MVSTHPITNQLNHRVREDRLVAQVVLVLVLVLVLDLVLVVALGLLLLTMAMVVETRGNSHPSRVSCHYQQYLRLLPLPARPSRKLSDRAALGRHPSHQHRLPWADQVRSLSAIGGTTPPHRDMRLVMCQAIYHLCLFLSHHHPLQNQDRGSGGACQNPEGIRLQEALCP